MSQQYSTVQPSQKKRKVVLDSMISSQLQSIELSSLQTQLPLQSQEESLNEMYSINYPMTSDIPSDIQRTECILPTATFDDQCQSDVDLITIQISIIDQYISLLLRESSFFHLLQSNLVIFSDYTKNILGRFYFNFEIFTNKYFDSLLNVHFIILMIFTQRWNQHLFRLHISHLLYHQLNPKSITINCYTVCYFQKIYIPKIFSKSVLLVLNTWNQI